MRVLGKTLMGMLILMILAGCTGKDKQLNIEDKPTIAVSTIGFTHAWPKGVLHYAEEEVEKVAKENDWNYVCVVGETTNEQSNQVIALVEEKVDCIVMLPMDGAALKTAAKAVQKAGIPLVMFDREIPDFAPTATIKGDNPGIGILTAEVFNDRFYYGTTVLEIMGDASTVPFQRTTGYEDTINSAFTKIQLGYTGWQRNEAYTIFNRWVEESSQAEIDMIEAIFTHDDEIALGILDALDDYESDPTFEKCFDRLKIIASSSGSKEIYSRMLTEEKYEVFSLTYPPAMVREAIRTAEKIMKDEPYEEMTIIPTVYVDKKNVHEFLDEDSPF